MRTMPGSDQVLRLFWTLTLRRSLAAVATPLGRILVAVTALLYALGSMIEGQMLIYGPTGDPLIVTVYTTPQGPQWWNYPAVWIIAPGGQLVLPFFATLSMVVISIGVGVGMSVGIVLAIELVRQRRRSLGAPTALSSAAGLTPAMIALVTLGACCATTAAGVAGVGVVGQATGTGTDTLLANSWYLGVFQIGVLWAALIAQEQIITVYGALFTLEPGTADSVASETPISAGSLARLLLRVVLLVAGVTWSLAMFAEWISISPLQASAGTWTWWILEHQVPALTAVLLALSPQASLEALRRLLEGATGPPVRAILAISGLLLLLWVPAPVVALGLHGLGNEVLGAAGEPASWGAVAPNGISSVALALRWGLQFVLTGGMCLALAARPGQTLGLLGLPREAVEVVDRPRPSDTENLDLATDHGPVEPSKVSTD